MKKMLITACTVLALALTAGVSLAQNEAPKGVEATITGENISLLKVYGGGAEGAEGLADLNALKVTSATGADGKAIAGLEGKVLSYVPTKAAQALLKGEENAGKTVTVKGTLYADANVLSVASFEAAAAADDFDLNFDELPVQTMSQQQVL
ncbi:MAG: hypothetical protein IT368_11455 [Candidatus Hydrogenedentes bacterium]|nr:hypothetical protein [Candidatus Hydrogenedentota bacterium]